MPEQKQQPKGPFPVGKWFMTFPDRDGKRLVAERGVVTALVKDDVYLCQFYEWLVGSPGWYGTKMIRLGQMVDEHWCFYDTADECGEAFEYGGAKHAVERDAKEHDEKRKKSDA
jgi:hypothetical protein